MQEAWVRFLGWEDPLEKEMATHSSIVAWRIPVTEEPGRLLVHEVARVIRDLATKPPPNNFRKSLIFPRDFYHQGRGKWFYTAQKIDIYVKELRFLP